MSFRNKYDKNSFVIIKKYIFEKMFLGENLLTSQYFCRLLAPLQLFFAQNSLSNTLSNCLCFLGRGQALKKQCIVKTNNFND
ncbi:hypothetical protein BpHYR1_004157 [Brachionus plicatilis]|uniref:Uncharacterized protein n=1 Tax=Brachionus plicatilis TaxID=10195 RepID=A0A3M7PFY7_BRAPC|nr:hypothetical protein BpHYR1_004157 [Brachionus plicatilis]